MLNVGELALNPGASTGAICSSGRQLVGCSEDDARVFFSLEKLFVRSFFLTMLIQGRHYTVLPQAITKGSALLGVRTTEWYLHTCSVFCVNV